MKLPKQIKIGPHNCEVTAVSQLRSQDGAKLLGEALCTSKTIVLDKDFLYSKDIADSMKLVVLVHEVVHLCLASSNLSIDTEEKIAEQLGESLTQVLIDNHKLTKAFDELRQQKERGTKVQLW